MAFYRSNRRAAYAAVYLDDKCPCHCGGRADHLADNGKVIGYSGFGSLALPNRIKRQIYNGLPGLI